MTGKINGAPIVLITKFRPKNCDRAKARAKGMAKRQDKPADKKDCKMVKRKAVHSAGPKLTVDSALIHTANSGANTKLQSNAPVIIETERGAIPQSFFCEDWPIPLQNKTKLYLAMAAFEMLAAIGFLVTLTAKTNCLPVLGFGTDLS